MIDSLFGANTLRIVRITAVHPEGQKFEGIALDNGDFIRDVQVASPMAGTDFGFTSGLPRPEVEGHDENMTDDPDRRTLTAVVATLQGINICLGFIYPQITQMAFTKQGDPDRLIERHPSDFYRTVSGDADMDLVHPSQAYIRIGEGTTPDALDGRDFDRRWRIKHNMGRSASITLATPHAKVTVSGDGDVIIDADGRISLSTKAQAEIAAIQKATTAAPVIDLVGSSRIDVLTPALTVSGGGTRLGMSDGAMGIQGERALIDVEDRVDVLAATETAITSPNIRLTGTTLIDGDIDIEWPA